MNKLFEILNDEQNAAAIQQCNTKEEVVTFLNEKGAEVTVEEMQKLADIVREVRARNDDAMDLDAMDNVAGGGFFGSIGQFFVDMFTSKPVVTPTNDGILTFDDTDNGGPAQTFNPAVAPNALLCDENDINTFDILVDGHAGMSMVEIWRNKD